MAEGRLALHVEGKQDLHVVVRLLLKSRSVSDHRDGNKKLIRLPNGRSLRVHDNEGKDALLSAMPEIIRTNIANPVGFVLDADEDVPARWRKIEGRLKDAGMANPPKSPIQGGFIGFCEPTKTRVGVWLMPDNAKPGKLEDFLKELVPAGDDLIAFAETATKQAKQDHGAKYPDKDFSKALMYAWLAWQEHPGRPYGQAISSGIFNAGCEASKAFIDWFKRLFLGET